VRRRLGGAEDSVGAGSAGAGAIQSPDIRFAHELADAADAITSGRFRALDLVVETKPDLTPVSEADRAAEDAIRELVARNRTGEGVAGEERGLDDSPARWVVDPIDGTRNYVRGNPVWGTLIALERDGRVDVAVVSAPALGKRWWAERGAGAWSGEQRCRVSTVASLDAACVSATSEVSMPPGWRAVAEEAWTPRGFGDFWQYCLLAEGSVDVAADERLQLWDYAAVQLLVEEAGGRCSTFAGAPPSPGESFLASNGLLHDRTLALLGS
jgi:histidinol-phosphatase